MHALLVGLPVLTLACLMLYKERKRNRTVRRIRKLVGKAKAGKITPDESVELRDLSLRVI